MKIPLIYEVPLFLFIILAIYTIYQLWLAKKPFAGGSLVKPYNWFIAAAVFLGLWAVDHIYNDLIPRPAELTIFFHYVISHGMLLISMVCIAVAAAKTKSMFSEVEKMTKQ